jgi:hypothetical protein
MLHRRPTLDRPRFNVTPEGLRAYAQMYEISASDAEIAALAEQLAGGLEGLAALLELDLEGVEPFVAFPVDRVRI